MKNKKIIIGIFTLTFVMIVSIVILKNAQETKMIVDNTYNMFSGDVDTGVGYLFESKEYGRMKQSSKIEKMGELLNLYQNNGIIENLYYDESSEAYTFLEVKTGGLSVVSLKEFDPMMN